MMAVRSTTNMDTQIAGHKGCVEVHFRGELLMLYQRSLVASCVVTFGILLIGAATLAAADRAMPLLVTDNFENGMSRWSTTDPDSSQGVWRIVETGEAGNHALRCTGTSKYQPPFRSPHSIAFLKDEVVGDFELTVRVQETNVNAGPHRDLCIFWGYQDPSHFYYVHLGAKADPHACQIFIVNGAARKAITVDEAKGTPWSEGWHDVKVVRNADDGMMKVYFDDMNQPMMTAKDTTFTWGKVGLGTFDDHGNFDDFELRGERAPQK
jgi:hypothetical protein